MSIPDTISLKLPAKAEYVSIARLTASGISSLIGFDFDAIEDIKVSISEVLAKIIEKMPETDEVRIHFDTLRDGISISFLLKDDIKKRLFDNDADSFSLAIINALMDETDIQRKDHTIITIVKKLGKAV